MPQAQEIPFTLGGTDSTNFGANSGDYFRGLIDDVTVYQDALTNTEVGWLYNFGSNPKYGYDSASVQQLFTLAETQSGSVTLNGLTWLPLSTTLPGGMNPGDVVLNGATYFALLDNGFAIQTLTPLVPEPSALALFSVVGLLGAGVYWRRRRQ